MNLFFFIVNGIGFYFSFTYVDVGATGRASDAGVFSNSTLQAALEDGSLNIPPAQKLPHSNDVLPYVILADEAFPLKTYIMRPYRAAALNHERRVSVIEICCLL